MNGAASTIARLFWALTFGLSCSGCSDAPQVTVSVPLFVAGETLPSSIVAQDDTEVTISRAQLAFGPLYLCAGTTAGDLCDTARLEWLDTAVIDLLEDKAIRVGELQGVSGVVRSYMYDLGVSSQLTQGEPVILDAAKELGGVSLVVEGEASRSGEVLAFRFEIPISQGENTEQGVPVVRKASSERFLHDVRGDEGGLVVRFDAVQWLIALDFRSHFEAARSGELSEASADKEVQPDSGLFRQLNNQLLSGERPSFEWIE